MWTALSLGAFTDNMLKQALTIALVFSIIRAPLISNDDALPIVGSFFPIAMLLFSTISGQLADKYETSFMFRRTKLAEFFLMVLAAIGFMTANSIILIVALFLMGAQSAFFSPVRTGSMPKYLAPDELVRGNALCSGGLFVSVLLGLVIGGLFITRENGAIIVSTVLIVAALGGWLAIRMAPPAPANAPDLKIDWNIFRQTKALMGYAINAPGVIHPALGAAWYWTIGALVTTTAPLFVRDTLHGDAAVVTAFMGLFAIGAAIGAVGASVLAKGRSALGFSTAGAGCAGVFILAVYFLSVGYDGPSSGALLNAAQFFNGPRAWAMALCFVLAAVSTSVYMVPLQAAVQRRAPAQRRARILAANNMLNAAGAILGFWSVLLITRTNFEPVHMFLFVAIAQAALTAYMFYRRKSVTEGLYDEVLG